MTVIVSPGQTIFDIAIEQCGYAGAAFEIALLNGISITGDIEAGSSLLIPETTKEDALSIPAQEALTVPENFIYVQQGQTLFDVAVQHCGDVTATVELAEINGLSISDEIEPGTILILPGEYEPGIAKFFKENNHIPATAAMEVNGAIPQPEGIDYWAIQVDFIIS